METKLKVFAAIIGVVAAAFAIPKGCHEIREAGERARRAEIERRAAEDEAKQRTASVPDKSKSPSPQPPPGGSSPKAQPAPMVPAVGPPPMPNPPADEVVTSVTVEGTTFQLESAVREGKTVIISVRATNSKATRELGVCLRSRVIDEGGEQHTSAGIRWSGNVYQPLTTWLGISLPSGVPVRFGLQYDNFPPRVAKLPLVEVIVDFNGLNVSRRHLEFRNIPITPAAGPK